MIESVKKLRADIIAKKSSVPRNPGYYIWWFIEEDKDRLLNIFNGFVKNPAAKVTTIDLRHQTLDGKEYYALYFGIATKDLRDRLKWHLGSPKHILSSIKSGFISTLRSTIASLLSQKPVSLQVEEKAVDDILDSCYWEWHQSNTPKVEEQKELSRKDYIYPLNIADNKGFEVKKGYSTSMVLRPLRTQNRLWHIS